MSSLNYIAKGEGKPVILIHGISGSLHDWEALMPDLGAAGYHAIAVDLPGHGESDKPDDPEAYNSEDVYQVFENWVDNLKDHPPYVLVGHSYGGYIGLVYALRHPQSVQTLVLIDPFYSPDQLSPWLQWLNRRPSWGIKALQFVPLNLVNFVLGWDPADTARFSPQTRWQIAVDYKRASPNVLNIPRTVTDLSLELHQVKTPSLIIWGENDLTLKPPSFHRLVSGLQCATGYSIPDSGHLPHIGNPDLVNRLVLEFMAKYNGGKRAG
jgi:pimeloyl-ACP methyl ester carboxylesterase